MTARAILEHPLSAYDPLSLLAAGKSLPADAGPAVTGYADAVAAALTVPLVRPAVSKTVLRGMTTSLVGLARDTFVLIQASYPDFTAQELEAPAALFLSFELHGLLRDTGEAAKAPIEATEIATRRGWKTVDDATSSLLDLEARLVTHGEAVLRHEPELKERFVADDAVRTYDDTVADVQRRVRFIAAPEFKPLFDASPRTAPMVAESTTMLEEAAMFRQSREDRLAPQTTATQRRNALFTALSSMLTELQTILRATHADTRPELLSKIDATYWWNLSRLGRKVKSSKEKTS